MLTNFQFQHHTPAKLDVEGDGKSGYYFGIGPHHEL